jgi:hypothetical protein
MDELEAHLERQTEGFAEFFWHRLRWRAVRSYLPRETPFSLLDVGAGAGLVGEYLAQEFPRADYYFSEPIEALRQRLIAAYGPERYLPEPRPALGIGFVTALDVIEHIEDDRAFLEQLIVALDPGTTVIITVPALQRLWSQWDVSLGHHRRYDRRSLRALLASLPVDVVEVSYLFPELVPAGLWRARRSARGAGAAAGASFPQLPRWANRALYGFGAPLVSARRAAPVGSSVLAVCRTH